MKIRYLAFTARGFALACRLAQETGGTAQRCGQPLSLADWTAEHFPTSDALVFVGAVGIAVRAVAPHLVSKTSDPAVVAVDETGRFAVPLASGHLGGGNDLSRRLAALTGGTAVITTATDVNGLFPVDSWARVQGLAVQNPGRIKVVSGKLLAGETVRVSCPYTVEGEPPAGVLLSDESPDAAVSLTQPENPEVLWLLPRCLVLGVGCKKGTPAEVLEAALTVLAEESSIPVQTITAAASIDLKGNEPGLLAFCSAHGWALETYSAPELAGVEGEFSASTFVQSVTGVDNVCERAAVRESGGALIVKKRSGGGVTMALAARPMKLDWRCRQ